MSGKADCLVIFASPHKNGHTARLLSKNTVLFKNSCIFDCFDSMPLPCIDCGLCKNQNACRFNDLDDFFKQFENAETVIFAFPVYNAGPPAPLKALIDRFQRFYNARFSKNIVNPIKGQRDVIVIMTMGSEKDLSEQVLNQFKPVFTISGCRLKKVIVKTATDKEQL